MTSVVHGSSDCLQWVELTQQCALQVEDVDKASCLCQTSLDGTSLVHYCFVAPSPGCQGPLCLELFVPTLDSVQCPMVAKPSEDHILIRRGSVRTYILHRPSL